MQAPSPLAIAALDPRSEVKIWQWRGMPIAYQAQGDRGPAIILIHGFGASWGHWRKNIPALAAVGRVFALDLLGFGKSAKPDPRGEVPYTFETWSQQIRDFCQEVVGGPAFLVGNSIGCIVAMQAAVDGPELVQGVALLNCSLRLLHDRRRSRLPWLRRVGAPLVQRLFTQRWLGAIFFRQLARPNTVRKILQQAYHSPAAVTDELVEMLMEPAADPGAVDVFLAFTRYSQGPLPEDLLEVLPCPALLLWGEADPWEPIELGRSLADYPCVENFIPLRNAGHCPQDEIPEVVNPILQAWILQKSVR